MFKLSRSRVGWIVALSLIMLLGTALGLLIDKVRAQTWLTSLLEGERGVVSETEVPGGEGEGEVANTAVPAGIPVTSDSEGEGEGPSLQVAQTNREEEYRAALARRALIPREPAVRTYRVQVGTRSFVPEPGFDEQAVGQNHVYIQFHETLTAKDRESLRAQGVDLQDSLGENTWVASVKSIGAQAAASIDNVRWVGAIHPEDKVQQRLLPGGPGPVNLVEGEWKVYITPHRDVSSSTLERIVVGSGGRVVEKGEAIRFCVALIPPGTVLEIASHDEVQHVGDASAEPKPALDEARPCIAVDDYQGNPLLEYKGNGIKVGQWEAAEDNGHNTPDISHPDFDSRVVLMDPQHPGNHATWVAGIIVGNGSKSSESIDPDDGITMGTDTIWRGIAREAILHCYNTDSVITEMRDAIADPGIGISLSNHSYSVHNEAPYPPGTAYTSDARNYDRVVTDNWDLGSTGRRISVVFCADNQGGGGWGTVSLQGAAKDVITVGAISDLSKQIMGWSSRGPCADGRIKPDLVAPGENVTSTCVWVSPWWYYSNASGTSLAAPMVSGTLAALYQAVEEEWPAGSPEPLPSTMKAILIHTAKDKILSSPPPGATTDGPDYKYGWGWIQAEAAENMVMFDAPNFDIVHEERSDVITGTEKWYVVYVPPGTPELKVTLVWDDPAAAAGDPDPLINDLDLQLQGPQGYLYYPWTLDWAPGHEGWPAVQTQRNDADNVEQVYVQNPASGIWNVLVYGNDIQSATPQSSFSLVSSQPLIPDYNRFYIKNAGAIPVAYIDTEGCLALRGTATTGVTPSRTTDDEFVVTNNSGQPRTIIHASDLSDPDCGDLVTAGTILQNQGYLTSDSTKKEMIFKNGAGQIVAIINEDGNIKLVKDLLENLEIQD